MSWLFGNKENTPKINWHQLTSLEQLKEYKLKSNEQVVVFFKHSTRCSISSMAKSRFERNWNYEVDQILPVYLDLIAHRDISNALAEEFNVIHQSPQILVIKGGECIYNISHNQIDADKLAEFTD